MSDLTQTSIIKCCEMLSAYIADKDLDCEESFYQLINNIELLKFALPDELCAKIDTFINSEIEPAHYYNHSVALSEKDMREHKDGTIELLSDEAMEKIMVSYYKLTLQISSKIKNFGEEILRPYLV